MASRPWSDKELALLEAHAESNDWLRVSSKIRDRTVNAVKVKMSKLRSELGFQDGRYIDGSFAGSVGRTRDAMDRYNANAIAASQQLLAATVAVGMWE